MVASQNEIASKIGADVIAAGGTAVDAAVATAFALAVIHPTAGNIGGGGFIVYRPANGDAVAYDFREVAPAKASPTMFLKDGKYSAEVHHNSHLAVGVPGTVAGLHLAWKEQGKLPWKRLVDPAVTLARDGFVGQRGPLALAQGRAPDDGRQRQAGLLDGEIPGVGRAVHAGTACRTSPATRSSSRIWRARSSASPTQGPAGFYEGETALALEKEMLANGGLITREDLKNYAAKKRAPVKGTYRGYEVISMPPPSSGGIGVDRDAEHPRGLRPRRRWASARPNAVHLMTEAMRRAFAGPRALSRRSRLQPAICRSRG